MKAQGEGDCVYGGLVYGVGYRDGQPSSIRLPGQSEEWAALPLDRDGFCDELYVHVLVKVCDEAAGCPLDQASVSAGLTVALQLGAQPSLVKRTTWSHR
ncbi:MAG TPA: hypothetical protein VGF95_02975 [Solirubrobacteraceae bacterium]